MNKLNLRQIDIGPSVALGRRGCVLESGKQPFTDEYYDGTPFEKIYKENNIRNWGPYRDFIKEKFPDILSVCRKSYANDLDKGLKPDIVNKLKECYILDDNLSVAQADLNSFGNLFECIVGYALHECHFQPIREAKIKYPFSGQPYDPDGQLYDILAALDISKLLWIECKKPLYINENNPIGQVLSKENIEKFIRRALFLKPDIAIYLVDTKEMYRDTLRQLFHPSFLQTGSYVDYFDNSENIIARINGFMYFCRVNFKSNNLFFSEVKKTINQVLYDSIKIRTIEANFNLFK